MQPGADGDGDEDGDDPEVEEGVVGEVVDGKTSRRCLPDPPCVQCATTNSQPSTGAQSA
eukprot:m.492157 g.492157  ORF g.492157 m.492157 type:complete len:59 (+) comp31711_c0_seq1:174-350(+)